MIPDFPPCDTFLARRLLRWLDYGEGQGIECSEMLAAAGLDEEQLRDTDQKVSGAALWRLSNFLAVRLEDPDLGIAVGSTARLGPGGGLIGYSVTHSRDLGQALRRLVRYSRIVAGASKLSLTDCREGWRLRADEGSLLTALRPPLDDALAAVISACRQITGRDIAPVAVEFPYGRPASLVAQRAHFRARLVFDQRRAAIVFRRQDLELSLVAADEKLSTYLDRLADQELALLEVPDSLTERVRRVVWRDLADGSPSLEQVAADLGFGARTLQRRLREEETTFAAVVEEVRRRMAGGLLRSPELAIYEIAYMLGYSEPSTFYRAFRRWHGRSPEEVRQSRLSG